MRSARAAHLCNEMSEAATALDAIIRTRRWQHALFTTYTLSLTFFESIVLRALQSQECADIWVVADADGYRGSLMERRSGRVGQEYRLVPVALPRGVFHAKCAYFSGPDGDLLLVGSGNLTFGGYGKNLEVLEILDARTDPACFADFAEFLDVLQARSNLLASDLSWARIFAELARAASRRFAAASSLQQPRLMHSVSVPVLDQLAALCPDPAPHRELMVLSPFHDADGSAPACRCDRVLDHHHWSQPTHTRQLSARLRRHAQVAASSQGRASSG